jgi:hypothetical protein
MNVPSWLTSLFERGKEGKKGSEIDLGDPAVKHWPRIEQMLKAEEEERQRVKEKRELPQYRVPLAVRVYYIDRSVPSIAQMINQMDGTIGDAPQIEHAQNAVLYSLQWPNGWHIDERYRGRYVHCFMISGRTNDLFYRKASSEAGDLIQVAHENLRGNQVFRHILDQRPQTLILYDSPNAHDFGAKKFLYGALGRRLKKGVV